VANNRIFYAAKRAGIAPVGSNSYQTLRGLQSIGMTTTFNLEQVFEIGQLAIYENIEGIPDVQVELEKVLDGAAPLYTLATQLAGTPSLTGRSTSECSLAVQIFPDTVNSATNAGQVEAEVQMSGLFVNSISYSVSVDANATESITLVGNDRVWIGMVSGGYTTHGTFDDPFVDNDDQPTAIAGSGGVNRREDVLFVYPGGLGPGVDVNGAVSGDGTVLPTELPGITSSGTNEKDADGNYAAHIQNFSASVELGREDLFELGRRGNYHKFVNFPTEVTTEIGMISVSGDLISVTEAGTTAGTGACPVGTNLSNQTIRLHMCEGLQLNLGKANKLSSVGVTGGDAGGGNEELTFTYSNFNDFTVYHPNDPNWAGLDVAGEDYDSDFDPMTKTVTAKI
jgi:hypothetical protein